MNDLTGWDVALWIAAGIAAVLLLVRIMLKFRGFWLAYYQRQVQAAQRRQAAGTRRGEEGSNDAG